MDLPLLPADHLRHVAAQGGLRLRSDHRHGGRGVLLVTDLSGDKASTVAQLSVALVGAIFIFFGLMTARSQAYARAEQGLPKHDS
jgi:hypothetical protein